MCYLKNRNGYISKDTLGNLYKIILPLDVELMSGSLSVFCNKVLIDHDLLLKIVNEYEVLYIDKVIVRYRIHKDNLSKSQTEISVLEESCTSSFTTISAWNTITKPTIKPIPT